MHPIANKIAPSSPKLINYQNATQQKQGTDFKSTPRENRGSDHMDLLKSIYGEKKLKQIGIIPCVTCASRVYQDGSDDPGVSFKTPQHVAPEASFSAVMSHEMEHVSREQSKAERESREVIAQSVTLHRAICPECGKQYVAGGVTRTTTRGRDEPKDFNGPSSEDTKGAYIDFRL